MQRSPQHIQKENKMQRALMRLLGVDGYNGSDRWLPPVTVAYVSATLLPVFLQLARDDSDVKIIYTQPGPDYVGIGDAVPLKDENGNELFIPPFSRGPRTTVLFDQQPSLVKRLLQNVAATTNALLLDVTTPRVTAEGNAFQEADKCQRFCIASGRPMAVVVIHSRETCVRLPGNVPARGGGGGFVRVEGTIESVLADLDLQVGQDVAIGVFGYSQMIRSASFRTSLRVPTHMACYLEGGMTLEALVQAFGRISGLNMKCGAVVLMTQADFTVARLYPLFLRAVETAMRGGLRLRDVLSENREFAAEFAELKKTVRSIGHKNLGLTLPFRVVGEPAGGAGPSNGAAPALAARSRRGGAEAASDPALDDARREHVLALLRSLRLTNADMFHSGADLVKRLRRTTTPAGRALFPTGWTFTQRAFMSATFMAAAGIEMSGQATGRGRNAPKFRMMR